MSVSGVKRSWSLQKILSTEGNCCNALAKGGGDIQYRLGIIDRDARSQIGVDASAVNTEVWLRIFHFLLFCLSVRYKHLTVRLEAS